MALSKAEFDNRIKDMEAELDEAVAAETDELEQETDETIVPVMVGAAGESGR